MPLRPLHWTPHARIGIVLGAFALHVVVFFLPLSKDGVYDTGFAAVPVLVTAIFFGLRGGLAGALGTIPLHMGLFATVGAFDFHRMSHVFFPETFAVVVVGIGAGLARDYAVTRGAEIQTARVAAATAKAVATAQDVERRRIAQDLHDGIGSSLTTTLVEMRRLSDAKGLPAPFRDAFDRVREHVRAVLDETSRIARGLHPSALDDLGLVAAIEQLTNDFRRVHQIEVSLVVRGFDGGTVPPTPALAIFRVAQEALANIAKHAAATLVSVVVEADRARVQLTIEDNGRGFQAASALGVSGSGLLNMRDRARLLGGRFDFESVEGGGTTVFASIPLQGIADAKGSAA